jgi:hypothetical protein
LNSALLMNHFDFSDGLFGLDFLLQSKRIITGTLVFCFSSDSQYGQ